MIQYPYIGLRPFEAEESDIFFGREQHTDELLARLSQQNFLAVVGSSGCGKSSLVKTGLVPNLQAGFLAGAGTRWHIATIRPGIQPFNNLAESLVKVLGEDYRTELEEHQILQRSPYALRDLLAIKPLPHQGKLLIICDQFEEIFRYYDKGANIEAAAFVSLLLESSKLNGKLAADIYVVITMRSDFLGECAQFTGLAEAINTGLYLTPRLNREQLRMAIEEPALICDGEVEPALVVKLLEEVGNNPDQLPLLQHVLMRLWFLAKEANRKPLLLTLTDYESPKIGGLNKALSYHADKAYESLDTEQKRIAEILFRNLAEHDENKRDTRRPIRVAEIMALTRKSCAEIEQVVDVFRQVGRAFLMPPARVKLTPDTLLDIAHESLIRQWHRLQDWTKAEAESAAIYRRLEQNMLLHEAGKYGFYDTPELEMTLAWRDQNQPTPEWASRYGQHYDKAMAFLEQSQQEQQAERQREIAQARAKQRWLLTGLVLAFALTAWATWEWYHAQQTEQQRVIELFSSRLTHASLLAKSEDYAGAKTVLKDTNELDKQVSPASRHARNLLHSFTQIRGGGFNQVYEDKDHPYALFTVTLSPDGTLVAAGGEHGTLLLFAADSGTLLQRLQGHVTDGGGTSSVRSIAFTPSGQQLISAGDDKKIILWQQMSDSQALHGTGAQDLPGNAGNPKTGKAWAPVLTLIAPDKVGAISISPDGKLLASGGIGDNKITLWDLPGGKPRLTLKQHTQPISELGLAFSSDGRYLASGSYDDTAILWDLATGKPWKILTGHTGVVNNLSFSADSQTLATASEDKTLRLWSVATGEMQRVFNGHSNSVFAVSWLGDRLLSGSADRTIRFWDSRSGVSLRVLQGHESGVQALALSEGRLWSTSNDGTVRRWAVTLPFQQTLALPSEPNSAVITPSLTQIAVGFANGDLALYESLSTEPLWQQAAAHSDSIKRLSVNQDGSLLATGSFDNSAKLWEFKTSAAAILLQETKTLSGHTDAISALAFSPNGQTLATASYDNSIGLFSLTDNKPPRFISAAHAGGVMSVEFDATGSQLLSCGIEDRRLELWDLSQNPATPTDFPVAKDNLLWASISPDDQKLVSVGREFAVNVYDRLSTQRLYHLTGHERTVFRAVFAPDSQQLATVSNDRTVKFWQLEEGKELFSLALPTEFMLPSGVWDFDFRCLKNQAQCLVAVPLVRGVLQLYRLGYESELTEDTDELKRQQLEVWRQYARTVTQLLQTNALQPAAQALRETGQIAARFNTRFPNDPASAALKKQSDCQQQWLSAVLQALPVNGDKTVKPKTGKVLAPALAKPATPTLSAECTIILKDTFGTANELNQWGLELYKQQRYPEAQAQFALSLQQFPKDLILLSDDAELALVQGDSTRLQQRLLTLQALYPKKDGVYSDSYPAIMSFLNYLADTKQTPEAVLSVIAQTGQAVVYGWDFSDMQPVLKRQTPDKQKIAALFIDFFQKRIDLETLKTKLSGSKSKT